MLLLDLKQSFYDCFNASSSSSLWDSTQILGWIQKAYRDLWHAFAWPFKRRETSITMVVTSVASSSSGTTLNVTSALGFKAGEWLYVYSTDYERHRIASVNYATHVITLETALAVTWTSGTVAKAEYALPWDAMKVNRIKDPVTNQNELEEEDQEWITDNAIQKSYGDATGWILDGNFEYVEGAAAPMTPTTVSGASVTDAALIGKENDYYKGWLLVAGVTGTVRGSARVTASSYNPTGAVTTFTLQNTITGFVNTDTYVLCNDLARLIIIPVPSANGSRLTIDYDAVCPTLVNDYDMVRFGPRGEDFAGLIAIKAAKLAAASRPQSGIAVMPERLQEYDAGLQTMKDRLLSGGKSSFISKIA